MIYLTESIQKVQSLYKIAREKFLTVVLECGEYVPGIVFENADIDRLLKQCISINLPIQANMRWTEKVTYSIYFFTLFFCHRYIC